jgi:hypothetical protein
VEALRPEDPSDRQVAALPKAAPPTQAPGVKTRPVAQQAHLAVNPLAAPAIEAELQLAVN